MKKHILTSIALTSGLIWTAASYSKEHPLPPHTKAVKMFISDGKPYVELTDGYGEHWSNSRKEVAEQFKYYASQQCKIDLPWYPKTQVEKKWLEWTKKRGWCKDQAEAYHLILDKMNKLSPPSPQ